LRIKESWRNWAIIFALLIATGLITALWPALTTNLLERDAAGTGAATRVPVEVHPIELDIPALSLPGVGQVGGETLEISPFLAVAALTGLIIGAVVLMGVPLAFIYVLLDRQRDRVVVSKEFQEKQAVLEKREKERLKRMSEGRTIMPKPEHRMPTWSALSTALIILLFVIFFGMVINYTFIPHGELVLDGDRVINSAVPIVGGLALVTLVVLAWYLRPQRIEAVDASDSGSIPWDFIAVLITGLIMIGIGIGVIVILNAPAA